MTIHIFKNKTSGDVYNYTQTHDNIKNGDILIVVDEKLVGIMVQAWPIAMVTHSTDHAFHLPDPATDFKSVELYDGTIYNYDEAIKIATSVEFPS